MASDLCGIRKDGRMEGRKRGRLVGSERREGEKRGRKDRGWRIDLTKKFYLSKKTKYVTIGLLYEGVAEPF